MDGWIARKRDRDREGLFRWLYIPSDRLRDTGETNANKLANYKLQNKELIYTQS